MQDALVFQEGLEKALAAKRVVQNVSKHVLSVRVVDKTSIWEYSSDGAKKFFRVTLAMQRLVKPAAELVEMGFQLPTAGNIMYAGYQTFESNVSLAFNSTLSDTSRISIQILIKINMILISICVTWCVGVR